MRKLPLPRFMKDATETLQAATPHRQAAREARENATGLASEVEDPSTEISPEQQIARRDEIDRLRDEARREDEVVHGLTAELQTRLPSWVKITK
jgi:hypothetical protein